MTSDLKEAPLLRKLKLQNFCGKGQLKSKVSDTDIWFQIEIATPSVEDTYDDIKIEKIGCVGHVQKRMGKHLLKKADTKGKLGDGKTIGGKDRLTEEKNSCRGIMGSRYDKCPSKAKGNSRKSSKQDIQ